MYVQNYQLEQNGETLPIIFIKKRDAIEYAEENLQGEYVLVFSHHLRGEKKTPMVVESK